jgi:hypothetical protein
MFVYFSTCQNSSQFFHKIHSILQKVTYQNLNNIKLLEEEEYQNRVVFKILSILQLFCSGHYAPMQNYVRDQFNQKLKYNLIEVLVEFLISFQVNTTNFDIIYSTLETLIAMV